MIDRKWTPGILMFLHDASCIEAFEVEIKNGDDYVYVRVRNQSGEWIEGSMTREVWDDPNLSFTPRAC